ncbi:hypothetical protein CPC735_045820 [Coccidioides posadasii C735 delta SOWgp]|uniref:Uncharacterized protein n=1 Tax=Coccidioides posadasii (strain C735) TaxID=222929 RepID=C5PEZ4_COCP7|nr:hypothetical protein CPC735_045820 [Coccidioides posadasii C735 delta SOWgp]EER23212.1 hypothetical protein CPC735_045820 [Coccidioides posadasii C735 delta SOWgp]|eukprot:XP_003065357.1 hypothetical protein CPC735_045820 [Coccidioides posadasii C735 delta SOWgp]
MPSPPAVVVPPAPAGNVVVAVPPAPAGFVGAVVPRGAWDRLAAPPRDQQWWSQTTFTLLPPAAFFAGTSRANPVALPGVPPHTGAQALSARERAWCRGPIQRPVLIAGLDNPNQLAVRAQLREGILVTRAGAQPPPGQECSACKRAQQGYGNIVFAECISAGMGQRCAVRN